MLPLIGWKFEIPPSFQGKWKIRIDMVRTFFQIHFRSFGIIESFVSTGFQRCARYEERRGMCRT